MKKYKKDVEEYLFDKKFLTKKIPKGQYKNFMFFTIKMLNKNSFIHDEITFVCSDENNRTDCDFKIVKVSGFHLLNIIQSQIDLTGLTSDDFKNLVRDKRKHPVALKNNEEICNLIDKFFEKINLKRELEVDLKVNNYNKEKVKI